jgi:hypothetical protein
MEELMPGCNAEERVGEGLLMEGVVSFAAHGSVTALYHYKISPHPLIH